MLQRIQTIYLLLAFTCLVLLLMFPIFSVEVVNNDTGLNSIASGSAEFGVYGVRGDGIPDGSFPLYLIVIATALLVAAGIMFYKKRPRQLLICRLGLIVHFLFTAGVYAFYYAGKNIMTAGLTDNTEAVQTTFSMEAGFYILIPPLAFIWLAIRGIKRDENLVKSLDRLR